IETNVNCETRQISAALRDELVTQIILAMPDAAEITRRKLVAADVAQLKSDLAQIKARLGITNLPPAQP
ncbi:MAG TPA: hypothetical protein VGI63_02105, partial [Verrucomicrobiae bacterium]